MKALSGKPKRCKACRAEFVPARPLQIACGPKCALDLAKKASERKANAQAKEERKAAREAKERVKTRAEYMREAQAAFNAWVRARDANLPCVSCGRHHQGQYHAGHYRSVGSSPALRFEPLNVWKQCAPCNNHLSGNAIEYRIELVKRIGADMVEWLEGPHDPKKYTVEDLKQIAKECRAKVRELKRMV